MSIRRLDHINIRTARLSESIDFYRDVIGMAVKPPPMATDPAAGAYCYDEDNVPIVHLVATVNEVSGPEPTRGAAQLGMIDHFALHCDGAPGDYVARLQAHGLAFEAMEVPMIGRHLIFVRDPNGILVELGFPLD